MKTKKQVKEDFGWHNNNGFDGLPSGWIFEEGEDKFYEAFAEWELENDN